MFYAIIQNDKLNGASSCLCTGDNIFQIEITEDIFNNIERYEYKNGEVVEIENYDEIKAKEARKQEILDELDKLDLKSIRAIRTDDLMRMAEYENKAQILRKELNELGV